MRLALLAVLVALAGCRTPVTAHAKTAEVDKDVYVTKECNVRDYPQLTDVPEGATNLGVVRVEKVKGSSDDEMYLLLREAICKQGGDALSGLRWVKENGKVSGPPTELGLAVAQTRLHMLKRQTLQKIFRGNTGPRRKQSVKLPMQRVHPSHSL